jgi:hypothetical protein
MLMDSPDSRRYQPDLINKFKISQSGFKAGKRMFIRQILTFHTQIKNTVRGRYGPKLLPIAKYLGIFGVAYSLKQPNRDSKQPVSAFPFRYQKSPQHCFHQDPSQSS